MKLTILGNDATCPSANGACSSFLIEIEKTKILLDMGNGSIAKFKQKFDLAEMDIIIISHFHFDHMADLFPAKYEIETRKSKGENISRIELISPAMPDWVEEELNSNDVFNFHTIHLNSKLSFDGISIDFYQVQHLVETYAVRISYKGKVFCYSADTGKCSEIIDAANNADLFLCEATYLDKETSQINHHLSARAAGEIACAANVKKLILTHLPSKNRELIRTEASEEFNKTYLTEIFQEYFL